MIPWRQRIERYVRSRLRENPVTIVTRFAKCVLSLSRALTAVIDEYKANISRPRKLGKNGRKGAAWHASPNGKFSERFRAISFFFSISITSSKFEVGLVVRNDQINRWDRDDSFLRFRFDYAERNFLTSLFEVRNRRNNVSRYLLEEFKELQSMNLNM